MTAHLAEPPVAISESVTEPSFGRLAVSPDGRWIATIRQEEPTAFGVHLFATGVDPSFDFTNFPILTLVHAETGEEWYTDLSEYLNEGQMPQGGLSWYLNMSGNLLDGQVWIRLLQPFENQRN